MRVRPATSSDLTVSKLLQRVGRTISFKGPNFHLPETLATVLRLTTKRLLRDR